MSSHNGRDLVLVGRGPESEALNGALAASLDGGQRAVAVLGEPGIGKTRLVEQIADSATARGCRVVWGRATRYEGAPPFWVWRQIVDALGAKGDGGPDLTAGATERYALLEALVGLLGRRAEQGGLVVVLEDAQWLDDSSWWLLVELVRLRGVDRMLLIVTARTPDFDRAHPSMVTDMARGGHLQRIVLNSLQPPDIERQVRALLAPSRVDEAVLTAIVEKSGGNPFFAAELGRAAVAGRVPGSNLPVTVREAIRERLLGLAPSTVIALDAASVLGRSFSVGLLAAMTDTSPLQAIEALDAAVEAAVLVGDGQLGCYRFAHPLMAEAMGDGLDPRSRRLLHRAAMDAIEGVHAGDLDDWAGELARHAAAGYDPGDRGRAVHWTIRAAQLAVAASAWEDAARLTRQALDLGSGKDVRLLVQLADASFRSAEFVAAADAVEQVMTVATGTGSADMAALAALAVEPIGATEWDARVRRWCETALRAGDLDPDLSARLHARLAQALMYAGEAGPADQASRQAILDSRRGRPGPGSIAALRSRQLVRSGPDEVTERSGLAVELIDTAVAANDLSAELSGRLWQLDCSFEIGDLTAATRALRAATDVAARLGGPTPLWLTVRGRATLRQAQGRYADALNLAEQAHRSLARTGHPGADGARLGLRAAVGRHIGHAPREADTFTALQPFERLLDDHGDDPAGFELLARVVAAAVHAEAGQPQQAARYLDSAGPVRGWRVPPYLHLEVWAGAVKPLVVLDRRTDLEVVHERLRPHPGRFVASGAGASFFLGPVDLHLGIIERALGRSRQAQGSLTEACHLCTAAELPGFLAEAQLELGLALLGSTPTAGVRELLASAATGAARLGMAAVQQRAERARTAAGSPLTARERDVASLVGQGLTNRQIAERLIVSERTAQNHVQHILGKLGLANRVQVASWWHDHQHE